MPEIETVRDLRRHQIVAAARALVAEQGLEALTFAALEQRLSFTRGVITWHFENKDAILRAVLQAAIADVDAAALAAIRSESPMDERARAVVREMVHAWLGASDAVPVLISFWGRLGADPDAAVLNAALYARYRGWSAELVRRGQQRGELRPDVDPEAAGAVLVALVLGLTLQERFAPGAVALERAVAAAGDAVVAWLAQQA